MSRKKADATALARGLSVGVNFLQILSEEIVAAGGFEEILYFLSKERTRAVVREIAKLIVGSEWQIPRSLMEKLARIRAMQECSSEDSIESDERYHWQEAVEKLGIPRIKFGRQEEEPVPQSILDQILGKPAPYPFIIQWAEEPHIIVGNHLDLNDSFYCFQEGEIVEVDTIFETLMLSPAKYFDLNK